MAYQFDGSHISFIANAAIGKFKSVKLHSTERNVVLAGAGERVIGVTGDVAAGAGEAVNVQIYGVAKVEAGGTISKGAYVKADANGDAVASTTDQEDVFGIALEAAVDGDIVPVMLIPGGERSTA